MVDAAGLRLVFFGTPEFAVPTLDALLRSRHPVVGVVTRADRPRGRGQKTSEPPVKVRAIAAGLPVLQPERLKEEGFLSAFTAFAPDLVVLAAYGKILTDAVLATPRLGVLNVHASLLPRHRGAAPVHRAVINGDRDTGVTIMKMVKALDAGPMLAVARHPIGPDDTSEDVERALGQIGADLLVATVDALASGPVAEVPQDEAAATYAHRITKDDGVVDWTQPAARIHDRIRGLYPWPHAYTFYRGRRLILLRSTVDMPNPEGFGLRTSSASGVVSETTPDPFLAGTILEAAGDRLRLATGDGTLAITQIQAEGRRPMTAREFLAGHPLAAGEMLTPHP
jgi:methionyl-tRNA formyltransferase